MQMDSIKPAIFIDTDQLRRIIAVDGIEKFKSQNSVDKGWSFKDSNDSDPMGFAARANCFGTGSALMTSYNPTKPQRIKKLPSCRGSPLVMRGAQTCAIGCLLNFSFSIYYWGSFVSIEPLTPTGQSHHVPSLFWLYRRYTRFLSCVMCYPWGRNPSLIYSDIVYLYIFHGMLSLSRRDWGASHSYKPWSVVKKQVSVEKDLYGDLWL